MTVDSLESSMLDKATYQKENLKVNATVGTGDAVYKMINSEKWHIILPITSELALI